MKKPNIRNAGINDIWEIAKANILMAKETENINLDEATVMKGVEFLIINPHYGFYLIAEIDDSFAGSLMITKEWSDWRNGLFWWIQSVYVKPEFRRKGVYTALYNCIKEISQNDEYCRGYRLYVENKNTSAIKTYEKLGMKETYYKLFEDTKQLDSP